MYKIRWAQNYKISFNYHLQFVTFSCRLSQLFGEIGDKHYFCNIKTNKCNERKSIFTIPVGLDADRMLCETKEAG